MKNLYKIFIDYVVNIGTVKKEEEGIIVNNKIINPYLRMIVGFFSFPLIYCIILFMIALIKARSIDIIDDMVFIFIIGNYILISSLYILNKRFYINKIIIEEDRINIEYFHWFKFESISCLISTYNIELKAQIATGKIYKLIIIINNQLKIVQRNRMILDLSEWNQDKILYVYQKLIDLKKEKMLNLESNNQ